MGRTETTPETVDRYNFLGEPSAEQRQRHTSGTGRTRRQQRLAASASRPVPAGTRCSVMPAMPVLALLLMMTSLQWTSLLVAFGWFVAAIICLGIQFYLCRAYFNRERSHDEQRDWIGMLSASELLIGMCWCLPLFLFWDGATQHAACLSHRLDHGGHRGPPADRQQFHAGARSPAPAFSPSAWRCAACGKPNPSIWHLAAPSWRLKPSSCWWPAIFRKRRATC